MGIKIGRDTQWTSNQLKRIFQELKKGNYSYEPNARLCKAPGCRNGTMINNITGKHSACKKCSGWGIVRVS